MRAVRGTVTTSRGSPTSTTTLANMPGSSLRFALGRLPRTSSVRVSWATRASSDSIVPLNTLPGNASTAISICWPTRSLPMACSGMGKSTRIGSSACTVTSVMPGVTYWPRSTLRMPSRPETGALMVFCAMTASILLTAAWAVSRLARAVSRLASDVTRLAIRSDWRWKATSASASTALALARSAASTAMSSCTSRAPRSTSLPLSACTSVTIPATWEATSTPCEEISVPIEVSCSTHFSVLAGSEVTVAGGGTCAAMNPLIMFGLKSKLNQTRAPRNSGGDGGGDDEAEDHDLAWHRRRIYGVGGANIETGVEPGKH